jgi:hypothetical protein
VPKQSATYFHPEFKQFDQLPTLLLADDVLLDLGAM